MEWETSDIIKLAVWSFALCVNLVVLIVIIIDIIRRR